MVSTPFQPITANVNHFKHINNLFKKLYSTINVKKLVF